MDLVNWAHLNQTLRLLHLYYLRFTGICVCSCHVSLFLEVSFNVPPHYVTVFARCDYPILPFTTVLALQSLGAAMTDLIEYRQLPVFRKIVVFRKHFVYLSLRVNVVVVELELSDKGSVPKTPKHRLEIF